MNSAGPVHFPAPVSIAGAQGDAAPDSLLGQLRADVKRKREARIVTVDLPDHLFTVPLRANYGSLPLDEIERLAEKANPNQLNSTANLDLLNRSCRSIEAYDQADDRWLVLEDDIGPVSWDDRLPKLLQMKSDDDFTYSVRDVFEAIFSEGDPPEPNGFLIAQHIGEALAGLGLINREAMPGESTGNMRIRSATRPRSE